MAGSPLKHERNRIVRAAILRGIQEGQDPAQYMEEFTDKLKELARGGDIAALRELFDRVDGKAPQQVQLQGDEDKPLQVKISPVDSQL